jgi:prepilin-type N-terminal cleavage/methylation domain-containing protein
MVFSYNRLMKGFTLIELLIVLGISALLSGIAITYTSVERNQIALSVETSKIAGFILRAKELSVVTYAQNPKTCAYGVSFDVARNTYSLFGFNPDPAKYGGPGSVPPCPRAASTTAAGISPSTETVQYSPDSWNISPTNGVRLRSGGNGDDLVVVLFYPPAPVTLMSRDGGTFLDSQVTPNTTSRVYLVTSDGKSSSMISVNAAGQISF